MSDKYKVRYIIPTMGIHDGLKYCIDSIVECHKDDDFEVVLVTENPRVYTGECPYVKIILCNDGCKFTEKVNLGLWDIINRRSDCDVVCVLNDDVVLFENSVKSLLHHSKNSCDILNPFSNCDKGWLHNREMKLTDTENVGIGLPISWMNDSRMSLLRLHSHGSVLKPSDVIFVDNVAFFCTFIKKEVILKLGYLDESMVTIGSDFEYCDRARKCGFTVGWSDNDFIFHFGAVTRRCDEGKNPQEYRDVDKKDAHKYKSSTHKKKILIYAGRGWEEWGVDNLYTGGIGGSETCLIYLSRYLVKNGFDVTTVISTKANSIIDGVSYRKYDDFAFGGDYDLCIASRVPHVLDYLDHSKPNVLWVHDIHFQNIDTINKAGQFDKIILLSPWHRDFWKQYGFDSKVQVIPDGIDLQRFNPDRKHQYGKFVFGSSWDRGLDNAIYILEEVRKRTGNENIRLHVYYGVQNLLKTAQALNNKSLIMFYEYIRAKMKEHNWIIDHDRVDQNTLANEYSGAFAWLYPTYFSETCCMTCMEMMAAGLPIIHNGKAGLHQYNDTGIMVGTQCRSIVFDGESKSVFEPYIYSVIKLLEDDGLWRKLHLKSTMKAIQYSWQSIVKEMWVPLIKGMLNVRHDETEQKDPAKV